MGKSTLMLFGKKNIKLRDMTMAQNTYSTPEWLDSVVHGLTGPQQTSSVCVSVDTHNGLSTNERVAASWVAPLFLVNRYACPGVSHPGTLRRNRLISTSTPARKENRLQ